MARYKYSENTKEVTDIYFDTETHGEFMGMEQGGEMKKVTTARIKEKLMNEIVLGVDWQQEVLTMTSTPPVSPTEGDRYIVGTSATGAWTGYDDYFAEYASGAWVFLAPQTRMGVFSYNDMYFLIYLEGEWQLLATLDEITELRDEVQGYRDEILNDPGFQAVSADLLGDDNIGAVATALAIITAVANNETNITAVAGNKTNINAVNANKANINAVAGNNPNITAVAGNETNINAVNANKPNIDAVAGNETNINAVNANKTNINTVSNNSANINTVATNNSNVTTVATSISAVNTVASDLGLGASSLIKIVVDNLTYVTSVANNITNVNTVAGLSTEITALGARTTEIDALYAQLSTIAEKENLTNKKSTLVENSEIYYPNQKAVNNALEAIKGVGYTDGTLKTHEDRLYTLEGNIHWISRAIGEEIWLDDSNPAVDVPPTDNPNFRFIKLTAGENVSGGYNEGVLINETVSGSAPLVEATAEVNLPDSPFHGQTVRLLNTEERFFRAGNAGRVQNDQMQRLTGKIADPTQAFVGSASSSLPAVVEGALSINSTRTAVYQSGVGGRSFDVLFNSANSPDARTSDTTDGETRPRNVGRTIYMRIL